MSQARTLRIALLHMKLKLLVKRSNLDRVRKLLRQVVDKNGGVHVAVLPAFVNIGAFYLFYPEQRAANIVKHQAERIPGPTTEYLGKVAVENSIFIVGGPIIERAGPRIFLTTFVISPTGDVVAKYRKLVINDREKSLGITSGKDVVVVDQLERKIGVMAEDDLLAPEIARSLVLKGATVITTTLSFSLDQKVLETLLVTRSLENWVPIFALGGIIEYNNEVREAPTIIVDPEQGGVTDRHYGEEKPLIVEMRVSKDKPDNGDILRMTNLLCKVLRDLRSAVTGGRK